MTDFETLTALVTDGTLNRELERAAGLRKQIQRLQDELDQNEAMAENCANEILREDAEIAHEYATACGRVYGGARLERRA